MPRYLDPKSDVVFKKIFLEHPRLLISFLNAVLPLPADTPIVSLSYLPNEQIPEIPAFKQTMADVKCVDAQGRIFIVEMQIDWTDCFKQRLLFGTSQALVTQLHKGENYHLLQPVYGLGLVADNYDPTPTWYHHYQLVKMQNAKHDDVIKHLQLIFIELPKFPVQSPAEKKLRLLWLRFLREIDEETRGVSQELLEIPEISKAIELSEHAAYSPGELNAYNDYWDRVRTMKTLLVGKYEKGYEKGIEKGIKKGMEKGIKDGIKKGAQETKEEIALQLFETDMPDTKIATITGLSIQEVEALRSK